MIQENEQFGLDLQGIISSRIAWPINKQLATKLAMTPHFNIGEFFQSLTDDDVAFLSNAINTTDMNDHAASELFLMMMLLSLAEGLGLQQDDDMTRRFEMLIVLITCEAMSRHGMAIIHREVMSLGEDMHMAKLVTATPSGLETMSRLLGEDPNAM